MNIRDAVKGEDVAIAQVHVASWQAAYEGLLPAEMLANLAVEPRARWWARLIAGEQQSEVIVCEVDGRIVGFACFGPYRSEEAWASERTAEIIAIYVLGKAWGKGYGRALMQHSLQRLSKAGYLEATLWVLKGNDRAIRFYEKAGFQHDDRVQPRIEQLGEVEVEELRYWREIR